MLLAELDQLPVAWSQIVNMYICILWFGIIRMKSKENNKLFRYRYASPALKCSVASVVRLLLSFWASKLRTKRGHWAFTGFWRISLICLDVLFSLSALLCTLCFSKKLYWQECQILAILQLYELLVCCISLSAACMPHSVSHLCLLFQSSVLSILFLMSSLPLSLFLRSDFIFCFQPQLFPHSPSLLLQVLNLMERCQA